ncbi:MAG: hypothetical protein ACREFQ_21905 [Stellaceae bacterium]
MRILVSDTSVLVDLERGHPGVVPQQQSHQPVHETEGVLALPCPPARPHTPTLPGL